MLSLSLRGSQKPNNDAPEETVNSLVESGETLENVSVKNEYGQNQYSSKVFFVKDNSGKPKKVIKVTYCDRHPCEKTKKEGFTYDKLSKVPGWKNYLLPYRNHGQKGSLFTYIIFDYKPGETMADRLRSASDATRRHLLVGALRALKFLAEARYLHGDIKTDNLWVTPEDDVRLFDLGEAKYDPRLIEIKDEIGSVNTFISNVLGRGRGRSQSRNRTRNRNRSRSRSPERKEISTLKDLEDHYGRLIRMYEVPRGGGKTRRSK